MRSIPKLPTIFNLTLQLKKGFFMDKKFLSAPFDMSEYIYGKRFVIGGVDLDIEDETPVVKEEDNKIKMASLTAAEEG